jgi:hypothetical protein
MNNPLEIINGIKGFISSNNPFRFPHLEETMLGLLAELENTLTPQPAVEEPVIEEPIIGEILEVTFSEPVLIEEPIVEEVAVSTVKVKRPRKK